MSLQSILPFNHLDANSFNIALYEMSRGTLNYNNDRIESLLYKLIDQPGYYLIHSQIILTLTQTLLLACRLADIWSTKILMIRLIPLMRNRCFQVCI